MDKKELKKYRNIYKKIEQLEQEKADLLQLTAPKPDGQPRSSGTGDPTGSTATKIADLTTQLDYLIEDLLDRRYQIEKVISELPERDFNLMHSYYILGHSWEEVAEEMNYSVPHIFRLHGRILEKMRVNDS